MPDGWVRLVAMDHTHCFTCGDDLSVRMANINKIKDDRIYGLFPAFVPWVKLDILESTRKRLREVRPSMVRAILEGIPAEWQVPEAVLPVWEELVCRRAAFVADAMIDRIWTVCSEARADP